MLSDLKFELNIHFFLAKILFLLGLPIERVPIVEKIKD